MKRTEIIIAGGVCVALVVGFFIYLVVKSKPTAVVSAPTPTANTVKSGFFATKEVKDIVSKKSYGNLPITVPTEIQSNPFGALE